MPWAGVHEDVGSLLHESSLGHRDPSVVAAPRPRGRGRLTAFGSVIVVLSWQMDR
jgi:hypothetical protein